MFRSNETTYALFKICNAILIVVFAGCEELGIGPKQGSPKTESAPPMRDSLAPPVQQAPVQMPPTVAVTPESMVADFIAMRSNLITDDIILKVVDLVPANAQITELNLRGAPVTRNGLAALARLPQLRKVDMSGSALQAAELAGIGAVTQLEELLLENAAIDNTSLAVC